MSPNLVQLDKNIFDRKVFIETHDPSIDVGVSADLHNKHIWEPYETSIFIKLITDKGLFVDVGANIGYYTLIASKYMSEDAMIISVEPEKNNLDLLLKNLSHNKINNVTPMNVGCGENDSIAVIQRSEHNYGDHQLYLVNESGDVASNQVVNLRSVDSILEELEVKPDVIKIDTQGFEYSILKGMKKTIASLGPESVIIMEFWPYGLNQHGADINELLDCFNFDELQIWAIFEEQLRLVVSERRDIERWAASCLHPDTQRYINLLITRQGDYLWSRIGEHLTHLSIEEGHRHLSVENGHLAKHLVPAGWSFPEHNGVWSDGHYSEVIFHIDPSFIGKKLMLEYCCFHHKVHKIKYKISINNKKGTYFESESSDITVTEIILDNNLCEDEATIVVGFDFINPISPRELGISEDSRVLGVFLVSYKLV